LFTIQPIAIGVHRTICTPFADSHVRSALLNRSLGVCIAAIINPCRQCPDEAVIAAIAARDRSRCDEYVKEKDLGHATVYDGYQELLDEAGDSIDAIYVPSPNGLHFHWTMQALDAGYHVLCEKPFAVC
jgi:predicted dehydrogenase